MADLNGAIEQAVEKAGTEPEQGQTRPESEKAPTNNGELPTGQTETNKEPGAAKAKAEWNGDIAALPPELQEYAKNVQRYVTKREQEAADARKRIQEFETKYNPQKLSAFEQWQQDQQKQVEPPLIDAAAWEEALLDPTGTKVNQVLRSAIQSEVAKAEAKYAQQFGSLTKKQALVEHEQIISAFAAAHPEFIQLHEAGIMKPILMSLLKPGVDVNEVLPRALAEAKKVADGFNQKALTASQIRVQEKKNGSAIDKTPSQKADVVWVDDHDELMRTQIAAAMDNKNVTAKIRTKK